MYVLYEANTGILFPYATAFSAAMQLYHATSFLPTHYKIKAATPHTPAKATPACVAIALPATAKLLD